MQSVEQIPFLPISFFKTHTIKTGEWAAQKTYTSSGTTGAQTSRHFVFDEDWYLQNAAAIFEKIYGKVEDFCFLALLPNYLEREGSSLIAMADFFIIKSKYEQSGFFLYDQERLVKLLKANELAKVPTVLIGVSFALLDLAEQYQLSLAHTIVMETGGMKGRRKEMTRAELHDVFQKSFGIENVHSEYGMTELLSQGYSKGQGIFEPGFTMQIRTREITDPFRYTNAGRHGVINIIDLANIDSCAFIATDDLGRVYENGTFEVLGRLDQSDIRGCNLMVL